MTQLKNRLTGIPALIIFALLCFACEKDNSDPDNNDSVIVPGEGVFIINEGNFMQGNASLGYYHISSNTMYNELFKNANDEPLGDVFHSMCIHDGLAYLVVNNSGKIEVTDPVTGIRQASINGFVSPRYFLPVADGKAYVSDLFSGMISIVDLELNAISGSISVSGWTEEMVLLNDFVWVAGPGSGYVYRINPISNMLTDSLFLGTAPTRLHIAANGHLLVLCAGGWGAQGHPRIVSVSPDSFSISAEYPLPNPDGYYSRFALSPSKDKVYVLGEDLLVATLNGSQTSFESLIPSNGSTFYGMSVSPATGWIFLSDAIDFTQKGRVMVYDEGGNLLKSVDSDINPSDFYHY
jgi:hypothetical protein